MERIDRVACVDVPALPLQLLLRRQPDWAQAPVVVVANDRPQAEVQWANAIARRAHIQPGMTYSAAQSLSMHVRAGIVSPDEIDNAIEQIAARLIEFSPGIEAAQRPRTPQERIEGVPGVFWLDPSGMVPLFTSLEHWGHSLQQALAALGLHATVVVGFHRYRCYALCKVKRGVSILDDPTQELHAADRVPLRRLSIPSRTLTGLERLDIRTIGQLRRLPAADLRTRFGKIATRLHTCVREPGASLRPRPPDDPVRVHTPVEPPDDDRNRLLFLIKIMLHDVMTQLANRNQAMSALHLHLHLDHHPSHHERLEPSRPTLDEPLVIDLVRLRLNAIDVAAPIESIDVELEGVEALAGQLALFRTQTRRDLDAADRALARLRAWLGPQAVTRGRIRNAHLPEARFTWEPIASIGFARVEQANASPSSARLVRRILPRPQPLRPTHGPSLRFDDHDSIVLRSGPFRISGGWWVRTVERDYYYMQTQSGQVLWVYYDRRRRCWYLQGWVD